MIQFIIRIGAIVLLEVAREQIDSAFEIAIGVLDDVIAALVFVEMGASR